MDLFVSLWKIVFRFVGKTTRGQDDGCSVRSKSQIKNRSMVREMYPFRQRIYHRPSGYMIKNIPQCLYQVIYTIGVFLLVGISIFVV